MKKILIAVAAKRANNFLRVREKFVTKEYISKEHEAAVAKDASLRLCPSLDGNCQPRDRISR